MKPSTVGELSGLEVRRASSSDVPAIIALAERSLQWEKDDPNEAFFRWKHLENPAGRSAMWVAVDGGEIVGLRAFLRWRWQSVDGSVIESVRAVDTATRPDHQGRGIFTDLTLTGVDALRDEGVSFVFNTPNDKSRPGYLKMGWQVVGRVPLSLRLLSMAGTRRLRGARSAADKWSALTHVGELAADAFADAAALSELLESQPVGDRMSTERTPEYLRWRYGFEPLGYRILLAGSSVGDGFAAYRLRRRGGAVELTLCDVVVPGNRTSDRRRLVSEVARCAGGDYLVQAGGALVGPGPAVRAPGFGPVLTWRALADARRPTIGAWRLSLGDVELF